MRRHRRSYKFVTFVLAVTIFLMVKLHEEVANLSEIVTFHDGNVNMSILLVTPPTPSTKATTTTKAPPLLALCPDMRQKEEKAIGQRFGLNGSTLNILGEAWGDPTIKQNNLKLWNAENAAAIKMPKAISTCTNDMTLRQKMDNQTQVDFCPCFNSRMQGNVELDFSPKSWSEMFDTYFAMGVQNGGERQPTECSARQKIAIIIPYKDRLNHLHVLINHLHKVLVRQDSHYRIFVVEQAHPNIFNKAALMDLGFLEALKLFPFDCVIFHDVDLLLEDDRNVYGCLKNQARHIASHTDKHAYKLPYTSLFGGGTAFTVSFFKTLNGYATRYWGWGGEDDDMYARLMRTTKIKPHRQTKALARFTMMRHIRDQNFPPNIYKNKLLKNKAEFPKSIINDGLSSLQYSVHALIERPLYTWIYAEAKSPLSDFFYKEGICEAVNKTSYFHGEEILIDCATRCQQEQKCQMFQFHFNKDWHPFCSLFTKNCVKATNASTVVSYIYTKGRSFPTTKLPLDDKSLQ